MRDSAQDLSSTIGKVVRINRSGRFPPTNRSAPLPVPVLKIWSYGHRNVQSAAISPRDGRLWTVEHGARGGDEVNVPEAGKNYGWPVITSAGLFRRAHRRRHRQARHGAAGLLLGPVHRTVRGGLLYRPCRAMAQQPVRERPRRHGPGATRNRGQCREGRGTPAAQQAHP